MKSREFIDTNAVITVLTAGALIAVVFYFALTMIARPGDFAQRTAALDERLGKAEQLFRTGSGSNAFAPGSVCMDGVDQEVAALKTRVQSAAQSQGVTLASLGAAPTAPGQDGVTLSAVGLQFQASGRYDQVMALLAELANSQPAVFVDTADLTSKTSSVELKFQGRVFCSASAHP